MISGRKPKPTAVHIANGFPGKRKLKRNEPKVKRGIPEPFSHLSEKVRAAWMEIGEVLHHKMKVLTLAHGHLLEQMANNLIEKRELIEEIDKHGRFQTVRMTNGAKKQVVRPAVLALADADKRFRALMEQCGITPSAQARVNAPPDEEEKTDPASKYFGDKVVPINR